MPEYTKSLDPATFNKVDRQKLLLKPEAFKCFQKAKKACSSWRETPIKQRIQIIQRLSKYLVEIGPSLSELISKDSGKSRVECYFDEILPVIQATNLYCKAISKQLKSQKATIGFLENWGRSSSYSFSPKGVVAVFSHWSSPFAIPMSVIIPALLSGCTVLYKPSEQTPVVGERICELFHMLGIPGDVLIQVPGDEELGRYVASLPVDKIFFFGHPDSAHEVLKEASTLLTPVVTITGGNDAMIVLEDTDLDVASSAAVWGAFHHMGQGFGAIKRCYVTKEIAEKFRNKCKGKTYRVEQGVPHQWGTDLGAMISEKHLNFLAKMVRSAINDGAQLVLGGEKFDIKGYGYFYRPTILYDVPPDHEILHQLVYGPLLNIVIVENEEEAIRRTNDSDFGLTASVWTENLPRGRRIAEKLEVGTVMINEVSQTSTLVTAKFNALKSSGIGSIHSASFLQEFLNTKQIHENQDFEKKAVWWFPYNLRTLNMGESFVGFLGMPSLTQKIKFLWQIVKNLNYEDKR